MIEPLDIGVWAFWQSDSRDDSWAMYYCRFCGCPIHSRPRDLPKTCPICKGIDLNLI